MFFLIYISSFVLSKYGGGLLHSLPFNFNILFIFINYLIIFLNFNFIYKVEISDVHRLFDSITTKEKPTQKYDSTTVIQKTSSSPNFPGFKHFILI